MEEEYTYPHMATRLSKPLEWFPHKRMIVFVCRKCAIFAALQLHALSCVGWLAPSGKESGKKDVPVRLSKMLDVQISST